MNLKNKIATFAAASILALGMGSSALAESSSTVTQEIVGGELTAYVGDGSLGETGYSHDDQRTSGVLNLRVEDARGTYAGWSVTVQSGAFVYEGKVVGNHDIDAANFVLGTTEAPAWVAGQAVEGIRGMANGSLEATRMPIVAAVGYGSGTYDQSLPVELMVPGGSPVGTYTATLTVLVAAAPGS